MTRTYTIPTSARDEVEKALARYQRKADTYGCSLTVEVSEPYAKMRDVWDEGIDQYGQTFKRKVGEQLIEVYDLTIESDIICKAGYTVVAKIEHLGEGNIVNTYEEQAMKPEWCQIKARCQHCGGNHGQKVTFIVRHEDGSELQVGRTCLKDYCGIDPQQVASMNQLFDLFLNEDIEHYDFERRIVPRAFATVEMLALAIRVKREQGYVRSSEVGSNRSKISSLAGKYNEVSDRDIEEAETLARQITEMDRQTAIAWNLKNVQTLIRCGYCKHSHFGYIAYAPTAYERYEEKMKLIRQWEEEKQAERSASEYIGKVGQRITVELSDVKLITSWETQYGYTRLYKMTDKTGNILIWKTSTWFDQDMPHKIKATVKEHSERDGVKQTVVSRCSVLAS